MVAYLVGQTSHILASKDYLWPGIYPSNSDTVAAIDRSGLS